MTAPNHLVGGFTFTGIFGSLMGINILSILFACLLPDIDHTKSLIGKLFLPISRSLNRRYGHRTITHSLVAIIALTGIIGVIQRSFFPSIQIAQVFALGYSSHLLLDMITVQGIPLFYPFKKNPCVIPGRPELRFRSGNMRHEAIGMCMFTVSAIFLQPLIANGFWTSYNRLFGTLPHVLSEYNKSDDLLEVTLTVQYGSDSHEASGYCIAVSKSEITLLDETNSFVTLPKDGQILSDFYPIHSGKQYNFQSGMFYAISIDSLHSLYSDGKYVAFELQGSRKFVHHDKGIQKETDKLDLQYSNQLHITEILEETVVDFTSDVSIGLKKQQLQRLLDGQQQKQLDYNNELSSFQEAKSAAELADNSIDKELLMIRFSKMKMPKPPTSIDTKVATLNAEINALKQTDQQRYRQSLEEAEVDELTFSGSFEKIIII